MLIIAELRLELNRKWCGLLDNKVRKTYYKISVCCDYITFDNTVQDAIVYSLDKCPNQ